MNSPHLQLDHMKNSLREASGHFSFINESKIEHIAMRLQSKGIGAYATRRAVDTIIDARDSFPSFSGLLTLCRGYEKKEETVNQEDNSKENSKYEAGLQKYQEMFKDKDPDAIKLTTYWIKQTYPHLLESGLIPVEQYKRCAILDWVDSSGSFEGMIRAAQKKAQSLGHNIHKYKDND